MAKIKGINWEEQPLGQVSDKEIAEKLGVNPESVRLARKKRGIPCIPGRGKQVDWDKEPLGIIPDTEIAKKLGITVSSVRSARATRNIPNFGDYFHIMSDIRMKKLEKGIDAILKYLNIDPEKDA